MNTFRLVFSVFMALSVLACSKNGDGTIADPATLSTCIVENLSNKTLIYARDMAIEIAPNELDTIASEGFFGASSAPPPSTVLGSLILLREENDTLITALEIDPIVNDQWNEEVVSGNISTFTLTVTQEMID